MGGRLVKNLICSFLCVGMLFAVLPQNVLANLPSASIVMDARSGRVIHQQRSDLQRHPASMTKMMTLYLVFDALKAGKLSLNTKLKVSRYAANRPPSKFGLRVGSSLSVRDAVMGLITKSANDVAVVIAEHLGKTEGKFAMMMNHKARQLGMNRTNYRNASGLPNSRQKSTARDMARLSKSLIHTHPNYYKWFATRAFKYKGTHHKNHNRLLGKIQGLDGIKTGFTNAAGFNLAASALRGDTRLIVVVMGEHTKSARDKKIRNLFKSGFKKKPHSDPYRIASVQNLPSPRLKPREASSFKLPSIISTAHAAESTGSRNWAVQVGVYSKHSAAKGQAKKMLKSYNTHLKESQIYVTTLKGKKGTLYRARLVGLHQERANRACKILTSNHHDCLVLKTR